ncbi:hypothetical protein [Gimesia fumaroli]|uniref:Glycosyltransferase family 25 (LPS biosynthesis protein) n=1 Tax=Gimesia fumaroli TaxID=2527976 RepID=A0A518IJT4_9PLAN|nr:hypothetical protein [Gimesia fumaroli]QDV53285.1 hypothetical protein Enr17x_53590 [Gimesia fumaroli]
MDAFSNRNINQWSIGITTAPRTQPTLQQTIASLRAAGWQQLQLFAEPGVEVPEGDPDLITTQRPVQLGAFPNWYLSLTEMMLRDPKSEAYLICQDDVLFARNTRDYLECHLWPAAEIGVVSIYCPSHYQQNQDPGFVREDRGWHSWGALAYVFSNPSARLLLSDVAVLSHRGFGPAEGLRQIDAVVGLWCERQHLPYFVHSPSLAQHVGKTSTLYPQASALGHRQASHVMHTIPPESLSERGAPVEG